ncbi:hypothetical protein QCA50_019916 [Cerrena zonata]|uniref:Uncharacterized protein n=1 Tax=Cerrena zonata TaxID=2478898 RepID=A0AAW0FDA0_9APHY
MSGYDSPFHLSEECSNASVAAPRAIVMTSTFGGLIGWLFMLAIAYTTVDLDEISADPQGLGQPFLFLLLMFAGDTAIGAIFSVGGISGFVSFTMPTLLKITYARSFFKPGPWNLGRWSQPIGYVSVAFVTVMIPILCFPTVRGKDLTPDQMNWTVLVYFGPMLMALIWFLVDAHKWYEGPKSNLDPGDLQVGSVEEDEKYDVILGVASNENTEKSEKS